MLRRINDIKPEHFARWSFFGFLGASIFHAIVGSSRLFRQVAGAAVTKIMNSPKFNLFVYYPRPFIFSAFLFYARHSCLAVILHRVLFFPLHVGKLLFSFLTLHAVPGVNHFFTSLSQFSNFTFTFCLPFSASIRLPLSYDFLFSDQRDQQFESFQPSRMMGFLSPWLQTRSHPRLALDSVLPVMCSMYRRLLPL